MIRRLSVAIEDVVRSIFTGTLSSSSEFPLERIVQTQILSQPKGSEELFHLLLTAL
jgi:hypothetical protein